ncbi:phd transcription factor [Phlyctema vagabunda]|uniref:Phd transcription factor n=1 Tax=Phlyctema vagabunda TaxID=108571 RepID=A0ABR4PQ88_9HELO
MDDEKVESVPRNINDPLLFSNLQAFLDKHIKNGNSTKYGAILTVKLVPTALGDDTSRARQGFRIESFPFSFRKYPTAVKHPAGECYSLVRSKIDKRRNLSESLGGVDISDTSLAVDTRFKYISNRNERVETSAAGDVNCPEDTLDKNAASFTQELGAVLELGSQLYEMKCSIKLRRYFKILGNPICFEQGPFENLCASRGLMELVAGFLDVSEKHTPITIQCSFLSLPTIYFNHRGASQYWIVIPPTEKEKFEGLICSLYRDKLDANLCSRFVAHLALWIKPSQLKKMGIKYFEVFQEANEALVIFPHTYYFGYSTGFNIIEKRYHAMSGWDYSGYVFCESAFDRCHLKDAPLIELKFRILEHAARKREAAEKNGGSESCPMDLVYTSPQESLSGSQAPGLKRNRSDAADSAELVSKLKQLGFSTAAEEHSDTAKRTKFCDEPDAMETEAPQSLKMSRL